MTPPPLLLIRAEKSPDPPLLLTEIREEERPEDLRPRPPLLLIPDQATEDSLEQIAIDQLLEAGKLKPEDVTHALSLGADSSRPLLQILNQIGVLSDTDMAEIYSEVTGFARLDAGRLGQMERELHGLSAEFLRARQALLLSRTGPLAAVNPIDGRLLRGVEYVLGFRPEIIIIEAGDWRRAFTHAFDAEPDLADLDMDADSAALAELADQGRDAPIVRRVAGWLSEAADRGASDIHFEARRNALDVSYRIDGVLQHVSTEPKSAAASVIARIKVLSELDLGERNKSQDGRASIVVRGRRLDVRVSVIATIDGESAVIRLLDRPSELLTLAHLGFSEDIISGLEAISEQQHGLFIVAGPTGSGKTTTLYACLQRLRGRGLKILSVEDPVEYHFDHVSQVQISEKAGRTFAGVLRSFLRHDPDVILVGEIRDGETARIAVQAALTGHLVLATVHAIDTSRVRTRLIDMGVEASQLDACMIGSMAQRLVRLLCPHCREARGLSISEQDLFTDAGLHVPDEVYDARGCDHCRSEGFKGRTALAELKGQGSEASDLISLHTQGLGLVAGGQTTFSEILGLSA